MPRRKIPVPNPKSPSEVLRESERQRDFALDAAGIGFWKADIRKNAIEWSSKQLEMYGVAPGELKTIDDFWDRVHPEDRDRARKSFRAGLAKGARKIIHDFRITRADGSVRWIHSTSMAEYEDGEPTRVIGIHQDVTDLKLNELRVAELNQQLGRRLDDLDAILSSLPIGVAIAEDRQCSAMRANPMLHRLLGVSEQQNVSASAIGQVRPYKVFRDGRQLAPEELPMQVAAREGKSVWGQPLEILRADGTKISLLGNSVPLFDANGEVRGSVGGFVDISDLQQAEEALRSRERMLRLSLDAARMGAWEWDMLTNEIRWSDGQYALFGVDKHTFTLQFENFEKLTHPDDLEHQRATMRRVIENKLRRYEDEFRIIRPDGAVRWIAAVGETIWDEQGRPVRMFGVNSDITERKAFQETIEQLNRDLQHKVEEFEALLRVIPMAIAVAEDAECKRIRVNETFRRILSLEPERSNYSMSVPEQERPPIRFFRDGRELSADELPQQLASKAKSEARDQELEVVRRDGSLVEIFGHAVPLFDENGDVRGSVAAFLDVTERKRTEDALRKNEKLAATGRLAASLAHEINNPLAAVTNLLYLLSTDEGLSQKSSSYLSLAIAEISRIGHITKNLLAFYRESTRPVDICMAELIDGVLELYGPKVREARVEVVKRYGTARTIEGFPGELRQVVSNLIVNAMEVMPKGGTITVGVREGRDWSKPFTQGLVITVADNGPGIARTHIGKIFEPFFTTKGEKGTGLGLWVSRDIINKHNGSMRVRSSVSKTRHGTAFRLFLPFPEAAAQSERVDGATQQK